jgi:outer membrane protein assembly factor BamB
MVRLRTSIRILGVATLLAALGSGAGPSAAATALSAGTAGASPAAASGLAPGDWTGFRNRGGKGAFNQAESILTRSTVSSLHVVDTIPTGDFLLRDFQAGGTGHGLFYTRAADGTESMAAYDESSRELRWTSYPGGNHLVVGDDAVYSISQEEQLGPVGHISAHDPMTGAVLWQLEIGRLRAVTSPVLSGQTLVVTYSAIRHHVVTAIVRAINVRTGRQIWQRQFRNTDVSGPSIDSGTVLVSVDGTLKALDIGNGKVKWSLTGERVSRFPPVASDGTVYVLSQVSHVLALDVQTGAQRWARTTFDTIDIPALALADGLLYLPLFNPETTDPDLIAFDVSNGSIRWSRRFGFGATYPVVAGNVLYAYVAGPQDGLQSVNPMTGEAVSLYLFASGADVNSEPMVSHGRMYISDQQLHAIQVLTP